MPDSLSPYPDLEQFRKQAKDLRKAHGAGSVEAAARLRAHVQRCAGLDEAAVLERDLTLRDAQHTVAREHGYAGWQALRKALAETPSPSDSGELVVETVDYDRAELVPVQILRVDPHERPDGTRVTFVVLRDPGGRLLPITIGEPEGTLLKVALARRKLMRPLGHEVFTACLSQLGGHVHSIVIHDVQEGTFHGHLHLEAEGRSVVIDARPSDALILAVHLQAPVYVAPHVIEMVGGATLASLPRILASMARQKVL